MTQIDRLTEREREQARELLTIAGEMTRMYDREYAYADKPWFLIRHPFDSMTEEEQKEYANARSMEINAENYAIGAKARYAKLEQRIQQREGGK